MRQQEDYETRAKNLRTRLYHAGITVTELAGRLGKTRPYTSKVLNGGHESKSLLKKIEEFLADVEDSDLALAA